jgi:hypothetical protein
MVLKSPLTPSTVAVATFKASSESLADFVPQLPPCCRRTFFSSVVASGTMFSCRPVGASGALRRGRAIRSAGLSSKAPNLALQRTGTAELRSAVNRPLSLISLGGQQHDRL